MVDIDLVVDTCVKPSFVESQSVLRVDVRGQPNTARAVSPVGAQIPVEKDGGIFSAGSNFQLDDLQHFSPQLYNLQHLRIKTPCLQGIL